ncbi:MAG: sulfur transferase domain-containing protein [Oligoflexia bacterium]|nr:sulfur transferase domain-containing protein [Oligoflexia bacterium]
MNVSSIVKTELPSGFPFVCYQDCYALCGQPQPDNLKEFKELTWTHILNLRNPEELQTLDFEMSGLCEKLSLDYSHIPIIVNSNFDKQALQQIHNLLNSNPNKKWVIHCASGTRSALALIAHFLFLGRYKKDELSDLAQQLGLSSLQMLDRLYDTIENQK